MNYVTLDDISNLSAAKNDPDAFLSLYSDKTTIIDEAQLALEIVRTIKKNIDINRKNGQFILSGSADIMTLPKLSESLAGRCEIFHMYPLSETEIAKSDENFVDSLFDNDIKYRNLQCDFRNLAKILFIGGYPEVRERNLERVSAWFNSYITSIVQRDIRQITNITDVTAIQTILELVSRRCGNLLNISDISRLSGIKNTTLQRYLSILESVFLICRNKPWHKTIDAKLSKSPKAYLSDTGLLCYLLGVSLNDLETKKNPCVGAILENFVFNELQKQISWSNKMPKIYHFRNTIGKEVDFILELRNNQKVGIEVKSSATVTKSDFEGLYALQKITKENFCKGIILYTGDKIIQFEESLFAVPITNMIT